MNIDFHTHGLISKRVNFDKEVFLQGIEYAKESNLDALLLSEHFNAINFKEIYNFLKNNFEYKGNRYIVNGISIFPAIEVSIENKGHVILSGHSDYIMEINKILKPNFSKDNFINLKELLDIADSYNLLKIGAHPFRKGQKLYLQDKDQLKRLDFLDLNAKDIYKKGLMSVREEVEFLARDINAKVITGTDSHYPIQLGAIYTKLNYECDTIEDIKKYVNNNEYSIKISKSFGLRIRAAKYSKRSYIKELNKYQ